MKGRPDASPGEILTVAQVAEYLQLNRLTVYRYIRDGKIPAVRLGRLFRITREDVKAFLDSQKVGRSAGRDRPARASASRSPWTGRPKEPQTEQPAHVEHSEEIYVGPPQNKREQPREAIEMIGPLNWMVRNLH